MKIEVCEQMMASWLQHIKGCQVVQTNWSPSPIADISDEDIDAASAFVEAINNYLKDKDLDIFKKSTMRQMILQCEIDIVGIKVVDGVVGDLYLIDSAFHESGLGYNNAIATVMKKILRAALVSSIVFPGISANVIFISPKCGQTLNKQLNDTIAEIDSTVKQYYPDTSILMLFNEDFANTVYKPLIAQVDKINNDNDLFMRSMKLSQLADSFVQKEPPEYIPTHKAVTIGDKTPKGSNKSIVFDALRTLISGNYMTPELLEKLCNKEYSNKCFRLSSYPFLVKNSGFAKTGYQDCRFYSNEYISILGEPYRVCSQWIPERIRCLNSWLKTITNNRT